MATTRFSRRQTQKFKTKGTALEELNVLDYSRGFDSYAANDALQIDMLRSAQDTRIDSLGRMNTRQGADFYSNAAGETLDDAETSTTGAANQDVTTTIRHAAKFTTTTAGRLTKVELNMKTNDGSGVTMVEIYNDSSGSPGTKLATSSIPFSDLGASLAYEVARFVEAPQLANATAYWIVVYVQSGSGGYHWSSTTNATTALKSTDSGSTWSATSYDMNFKTYISTDSTTKGLFRAYKSTGTKETLMAHGTVLYKISDVDGTLTSIKTGLNSGATRYRFANINDEVFYVNGVDNPRKYDFSTDAQMAWGTSGGSAAPTASLIAAHQDLIWLNDSSDPTRLEFSDEDSYETSASTNFIYVPSPKSPDPITALIPLNGVLYVFTTERKFAIYGSDQATFEVVELPSKKGTFTQETVAVTRNHIYYLSDDGLFRFNGVQDELLSARITDKIRGMANKDSAILAVHKNRLYIFYRDTGSGQNDKSLVYNLDFEAWESEDTNQYVTAATQFSGGNDDFEFVVASSLVGQAFYFDDSANNYSDAGCPLSFEVRTGYHHGKEPNAKKIWKRWYPRFEKQTGSYNVTCSTDQNFSSSPTEYSVAVGASGDTWGGGETWGGGATYGSTKFGSDRIHLPDSSYYLQLRVSKTGVDTPVVFLGHKLMYSKKRVR